MTHWIAVDWGTTSLRVWQIGEDGQIIDHRTSDKGMSGLDPAQFEASLLSLIDDWLEQGTTTHAIACGMVGARQGWIEAAYATAPCTPSQAKPTNAPVTDTRLRVTILPGVSQTKPNADVMRGEETQISGYLTQHPHFDGVICLPGTHTKWVHVSAGEIISFQTTMTGELFALLSGQSVLRHSLTGDGWDDGAFADGVESCLTRPANIASHLFSLRAEDLLSGQSAHVARARLSGMLIGTELAATKPYWLGQHVVLIGAPKLSHLYATALTAQGIPHEMANVTEMTLGGLAAAYLNLNGQPQ